MTEPLPTASTGPAAPVYDRGLAVVVAGGEGVDPTLLDRLPADRTVVAADSGADAARAIGLSVDVVVGDLDSITRDGLEAVAAAGAVVERHPVDKDHTDLDLALRRVVEEGFTRCVVLGGTGGRLSHLLANATLLLADRHADLDIRWLTGATEALVARPGRPGAVTGTTGDLVSLLAMRDRATGVTTVGLRWSLEGDVIEPGATRGVSNELTAPEATVSVLGGSLLVIHEPAEVRA